ncbi:MAG: hypothetical protein AUJ98_09005 [Bacteroidetes bacterium CG2_30_33_31]|nr:MAG: hypothetical protein AUJ98_09005 [Bacteroidetes bacterium CG2_30_33_31]
MNYLKKVLNRLKNQRGFDLTGKRIFMLERRNQKILQTAKPYNLEESKLIFLKLVSTFFVKTN